MLVFLDFEASSLAKRSYPIEVAWVFEDGRSEAHLILPAQQWTDWDTAAEAIHRIDRASLMRDGRSHEVVARRMVEVLSGYDLLASAPSWDGKWLSALLRAAGFPRHTLGLRRTDDAIRERASAILAQTCPPEQLAETVETLIASQDARGRTEAPTHRALPDAQAERARWLGVCTAARGLVEERGHG